MSKGSEKMKNQGCEEKQSAALSRLRRERLAVREARKNLELLKKLVGTEEAEATFTEWAKRTGARA